VQNWCGDAGQRQAQNGLPCRLSQTRAHTGFTSFQFEMSGKWLELLKEVAPQVTRVAILFGEDAAPYAEKYVQSIATVAPSFDTKLIISPLHDVAHIESAIAALSGAQKSALIVIPDAFTVANRGPIVALAARYQLPAIYAFRFIAVDGGLMSYGHDTNDLFRRATSYLDQILKGARPGDLPIQQPTKFELVINLQSAKALGLTVPASVLACADEVIE
jgi:putative ABC transport system substrate-binding protein